MISGSARTIAALLEDSIVRVNPKRLAICVPNSFRDGDYTLAVGPVGLLSSVAVTRVKPSSQGNASRRILLVDAMEVVRVGLAKMISAASQLIICAATGDYDEVDDLIERHRPKLMIVEPFHDNRDGITWIKQLSRHFPQVKILVASSNSEATYAERTLRAGAAGYWMKNGSADELLHAIETVLADEVYVSPAITSVALHRFAGHRTAPSSLDVLSDREMAVFSLIAADHGTGQIANELGISRKTVESHCEHIKSKLGYRDAETLRRAAWELFGGSEPTSKQNP